MDTLKIEEKAYRGTLGMGYLLDSLVHSGKFNIEYHDNNFKTQRSERGCTLYFNDKKILLDLWEYYNPGHSKDAYEANFDLIIKLQHGDLTNDEYHARTRKKNVLVDISKEEREAFYSKFTPWTFFPSTDILKYMGDNGLGYGPIGSLPEQQLAFFSGKNWKGRHRWIDMLKKQENIIVNPHDGHGRHQQQNNDGPHMDLAEYINCMRSSKYGLVLAGRGSLLTQAKNRREIDYMIMRKPLLINYKPCYFNDFIEGEHYILLKDDTVVADLEKEYDLEKIAANGYQWYVDNATPSGVAKSFFQLMKYRFP